MPLILISGYPSSGKTYRSRQLLEAFRARIGGSEDPKIKQLTVHHVDDHSLGVERDVYKESKTEKNARAAEYSAIKRLLSQSAIVIADGLNYIKGFRYQLYCEAKAVKTPSCVVHVGTSAEKCREINESVQATTQGRSGYEREIFENLIFRYEEPNGMNRWDSPLFTVLFDDEEPALEEIWEAIIGSEGQLKTAKPNAATVSAPTTQADYLYELDKSTQDILSKVLEWQRDHSDEGSGEIDFENSTLLLPPRTVTLPQLQRIRRQFISLNRQHQVPQSRINHTFIEYLNDNLN